MGHPLSQTDSELAKAYIILKSLLKALKKDYDRLEAVDLALVIVYKQFFCQSIERVESELAKLSRLTIRAKRTDQSTVWEVKVGARKGFIEVNVIEMLVELERLILK